MNLEKGSKVGPTKWFEVWTKLYDFTGLLANETLYRHHRVACSTEAFATQQMTAVTKIERDLFPEHGTAVVAAFITSYPLGHFRFASTHYLSRQQLACSHAKLIDRRTLLYAHAQNEIIAKIKSTY